MSERPGAPLQVLLVFLRLGLSSFGGPIAHIGYFRREFVERRRWLAEAEFAGLLALCQFLPGPASSQLGIAIGLRRAGVVGALAAWLGFTVPSALLLVAFGLGVLDPGVLHHASWIHGLLVAAVAIVAQAVCAMSRQFCRTAAQWACAGVAALACLRGGAGLTQMAVLAAAALLGWGLLRAPVELPAAVPAPPIGLSRRDGAWCLLLFALLLAALPVAAALSTNHALMLVDRFYRAGSLVFGGGHVVLPLLQAQVVPPGWISNQLFLAGYGAAQAVPGPLFSFAAYLGATMLPPPHGWSGAALCLVAMYLPSFLLVFGVMPFWDTLRSRARVRSALQAVNAAVVGVLFAALCRPVVSSAIHGPADLAVAAIGLLLLVRAGTPSWAVLLLCTAGSVLLGAATQASAG
jgi:chromate transporter